MWLPVQHTLLTAIGSWVCETDSVSQWPKVSPSTKSGTHIHNCIHTEVWSHGSPVHQAMEQRHHRRLKDSQAPCEQGRTRGAGRGGADRGGVNARRRLGSVLDCTRNDAQTCEAARYPCTGVSQVWSFIYRMWDHAEAWSMHVTALTDIIKPWKPKQSRTDATRGMHAFQCYME